LNQEKHICKSCGREFEGIYCNQCGEKIILPSDRSFRKFLSNVMVAVTFADSKFFKSLWLVIINPGFLSKEFAEGRTIKYLRPLSLFFVLNLIYFLFPVIQLFSASLKTQLNTSYGKLVQTMVASRAVALNLNAQSFEVLYNQKSNGFAKLLVIVFVIIASLPLNVLYRKHNRFFTDHVGLMVELACFNIFINALVMTLAAKFLGLGKFLDDDWFMISFIITNVYFLIRSGYTFYEDRSLKLILKSIFMIAILKLAMEAYRFILFLLTLWSV
jgi:Protein of unknown function (DUF3667)